MDKGDGAPQPVDNTSWATPLPAVIALVIGGFALVAASVFADVDPAGRLLVTVGAIGLWVISALAAYQRPRLWIDEADPSGDRLAVKRLSGVRTYRRDEISRIVVMKYPRLGRRVPMLEIDVRRAGEDEDRLMIFGRWDLGANPLDVYDALVLRGLVARDG